MLVKKLKKLKSLKGRGLTELSVRGAQALAACAEQIGLSAQARVPSDEAFFKLLDHEQGGNSLRSAAELFEHFRSRATPRFFASFAHEAETLEELRRRFGTDAEARLIERAERILSGRFDLLGFRDLSFGEPVDWHLEPVAQKRAPLEHWSRIDYLNKEAAGDKKIIWELNRHQYFLSLGRAYLFTRDERFAETFVKHLAGWMDENPPKLGINWASSLEVAFRSINWLWAFHFFKDSPNFTPDVFMRALKFLYLSARHLETYLSTYFSPNTHLTGEALGLFYLGTMLPEFRRARAWRKTGMEILLAELDRHVLDDGVYFEQTSYYHRYTTDFYTHLLVLCEANNLSVEGKLRAKLIALLDHLMFITRPDGTTPLFGDDDGGRLVSLDERAPADFRAALSTGAVLFGRGDYKLVAVELAEETLWLLGKDAAKKFDELEASEPVSRSRAFDAGGYYVMRDGWTREANYLLLDCGPHGTRNCGHAHADALSFEVAAHGQTLLVDPGTYTYTGSMEARDYFRSSAAHNVLVIDGESSSVPSGPFSWSHVARAKARRWTSREQFDFFEGEHDGYTRLVGPAVHARSVLFIKDRYWIVRDRVESAGEHSCSLYFHFAPGTEALTCEDGIVLRERDTHRPSLDMFAFGGEGRWRAEEGWVSPTYGRRERAPVRVFSARTRGPQEFVTFLVPRRAQSKETRVAARLIEAEGASAFELLDGLTRDLLLVGAGTVVDGARLESDFGWSWARFAREGDGLQELVLLDGQSLCLDGSEIVKAAKPFGYFAARRVREDLIVETDAEGQLAAATLGARRLILNGKTFAVTGAAMNFKGGALVHDTSESAKVETFA